jgi:hypothetical protein
MITIACNSCGKKIDSPSLDRNFFNVLGNDVCRPCWDKMKAKAESLAVVKGYYTFPGYRSALEATVRKMCK